MNASLTLPHTEIAPRRPARRNFIADLLPYLFTFLFATHDDPAAFRYCAYKYNGEID